MVSALRSVSLSLALLFLNGLVTLADSQPPGENATSGGWRLSWNTVDQGVVSWGTKAHFSSWDACVAARAETIQRGVQALKSSGHDVSENHGVIVGQRGGDKAISRVVRFMCSREPAWLIVATNQSRSGAMSEERLGTFLTEVECLAWLELEADFKARSLEKFGSRVSLMHAEPSRWTVTTTEALGMEAGQLKSVTAYRCVSD